MTKEYWSEIEDHAAFRRVRAMLVTHPKKPGKYARILVAYPRDGAGSLTAYIADGFGDRFYSQKGAAGGYGYDKLTAALSGMTIDGHKLTDHCGQDETSAKLLKAYGRAMLTGDSDKAQKVVDKAPKQGYSFTNWSAASGYRPNEWEGYQSCYRESGLDYLRALGYSIITVI